MKASWGFLLVGACGLGVVAASLAQAPPTLEEILTRHHVALTTLGLLSALRDPDEEVRSVAAAELADRKEYGTLPEILVAAEAERDPLTRLNMVAAASWMNSSEAVAMLRHMCVDIALPTLVRQHAARHVFDRGDHSCFQTIAEMASPATDAGTRTFAFNLLSQVRDLNRGEATTVLELLAKGLRDPDFRSA